MQKYFGPVEVKDDKGKKTKLMQEVNVVRFRESETVDGTLIAEVKQGKDGASIKLPDKLKALDWLSKHMDMATEEQKARIAALRAKTEKEDEKPIQITFVKASEKNG